MSLPQIVRFCRIHSLPILRKVVCLTAAAALLIAGVPVRAERTRFWRQSNYEEFDKGTAKGVALRSDGKLVLAPRFAQFSDPNAAYLWELRVDSKGALYAAGGANAKVVRFDDKGKATTVFDSQEMSAQAIAFDAQDNLYVGTSPDGKVYKVTPRGERSVFFEPKTKYIWDLAVDPAGTLYVATGDKGEIFAVTPDGKGQVYYKSEEMHARALAFDAKGNLVIGTEPNGLILRVEKSTQPAAATAQPETRHGFVIYETPSKEVTALLVDRAGNIYAAAIGAKARVVPTPVQPATPVAQPVVTATAQQVAVGAPAAVQQQPTPFVPFPPITGGSQVFRITPDGAPEELWSSREDLVYSLGMSLEGKLLVGTGNRGVLVQLEGNRVFSNLAKTASAQVTGMASGPGGKVFLCTANPGQVFTLGPDYEAEGTYESQAFDAKVFSQWGMLTWWGENGATDGQVSFYVRSGNTSDPEKNWSQWAGPYTSAKGETITSPPARFVQWRAVFRTAKPGEAARMSIRPGETPNISWVSVAYLPKNVAPTVDSIVVQNPGIRVQGLAGPPQQQQPVQLKMPPILMPGQAGVVATSQPAQPQRYEPPPQGFAQRGSQAVLWSARDDNEDDLTFSIYYRGEGEKNWKLLKDKLDQKFYSWDTTTMPDGAYYLKIVASDEPSNPPADALTAERESDRFEVDNTPPRIENLRLESASPDVRIKFDARDTYSTLARAEFSLDAGDWKLVFPVGRTTDAPQESYELTLGSLTPGEHTLAVRVYDQFENSASAKITFVIEPPKKR